jgi:epoxyqueuosine reductase
MSLTSNLKEYALALGFHATAACSAEPFARDEAVLLERISTGYLSGLDWLNAERATLSAHPESQLPSARSFLSLGLSYLTGEPPGPPDDELRGRISRYAWGRDYHEVIDAKMKDLEAYAARQASTPLQSRRFVDSGRFIDRAVANRAGLGWYGRNTSILVPELGSWVFLAGILLDVELDFDEPLGEQCGHCRACLEACPTGALVAPHLVDARRCISYLTVELKGSIARELRPLIGDRLFGCDACQAACPHNRKAAPVGADEFAARAIEDVWPRLVPLLQQNEGGFRNRFRGRSLLRAKKRGLQRNALVVLGNSGSEAAIEPLGACARDEDPLVREHAVWALGQLGGARARSILEQTRLGETDPAVRTEIESALERT